MAEEILIINGTSNGGWPITTGTPHHEEIDEYPTADTGDYIRADDDYVDEPTYTDTFTIPDCSSLQEGDTVTNLAVWLHAYATGDTEKWIEIYITNTTGTVSNDHAMPVKGVGTIWLDFTEKPGGGAWDLASINDITGIEIRPTIAGKDSDNDVWYIYQLYVKINYTPAPAGGPRGPLGHPLNGPFRGPI